MKCKRHPSVPQYPPENPAPSVLKTRAQSTASTEVPLHTTAFSLAPGDVDFHLTMYSSPSGAQDEREEREEARTKIDARRLGSCIVESKSEGKPVDKSLRINP
eukprot:717290-Pelagomonas_calceolata.AAC.4